MTERSNAPHDAHLHTPASLAAVLEKDYFPMPGGATLFLSEHEWKMVIAALRSETLPSRNDVLEEAARHLHQHAERMTVPMPNAPNIQDETVKAVFACAQSIRALKNAAPQDTADHHMAEEAIAGCGSASLRSAESRSGTPAAAAPQRGGTDVDFSPGASTPNRVAIPNVLFDGNAVYAEMDVRAHSRTSAENVSDVLDSVVRLLRTNQRQEP